MVVKSTGLHLFWNSADDTTSFKKKHQSMEIAHNTGYFIRCIPPSPPTKKAAANRFIFMTSVILSAMRIILFMLGSGLGVAMATDDGCSQSLCGMSVKTKVTSPVFRKQWTQWSASCVELYPHSLPRTLGIASHKANCSEMALDLFPCRCYVWGNAVCFANLVTQV